MGRTPAHCSLYQIQEKERVRKMTIKCKDQKMYPFRLKKCGRVKRIFWDQRGLAYYRRGNMRTYLDTVEILSYPYFYVGENGKDYVIIFLFTC